MSYRASAVVLAGAIAAASLLPSSHAIAAAKKVFNISSPALRDFGMLKKKYAGKNDQNKNCVGDNVSPPLKWTNAPANTKSFAIIMFDPAGRGGAGVVHWVAYDIPAAKTSLKEGEASQPSNEFKGGKNTPGLTTYFGPCPPFGDKPHPYVITLIASDIAPGTLQAGMTKDELAAALNGHVLGATTMVARFGH
ncbi:MAG TPA: YbhB/YbcL family Raf kinase inhibitor-like protein [Alphaproteobacteria bacterium]|nr:YbhB/YbcL family Raf kinase inhibitor-like protein [Alphaproteobacteria bacterium]